MAGTLGPATRAFKTLRQSGQRLTRLSRPTGPGCHNPSRGKAKGPNRCDPGRVKS